MLEQIILGAIQGITEWVPVSSKSCVIAAKVQLFHSPDSLGKLLSYALFLHFGTFWAAIIYFRRDILALGRAMISPGSSSSETRKLLLFLGTTTLLTALGFFLIKGAGQLAHSAPSAKRAIMSLIAALLIVAGFLQIKTRTGGKRTPQDLTLLDGIILGVTQAFATLPGLSRAGTTIALLSFRGFDKEHALKLSFLMSLPVILFGNIILNYRMFLSAGIEWVGAATAFVVGLLSISAVMRLAKKINFGWFLVIIGTLLAIATVMNKLD
jgi:undecaprenyl-diphosphatase